MFSFPTKRRRDDDRVDDLEEHSLHERKVRRGFRPFHFMSPVLASGVKWNGYERTLGSSLKDCADNSK